MKKVVLFLYQWLIAMPIIIVITIFTSIFTILLFPFKNSWLVHKEQMLWSRLIVWLFGTSTQVEGTENIQTGQSYVFVCNHSSYFDCWIVYGWLPVIFKWIMKAELRKVPFVGSACKAAGHIFIDRSHPKAASQSLIEAKSRLKNGVSLVIFPEGTRSRDGQVAEFKRGAFQIAFDLELPVVPISISGAHSLMPRGASLVNFGKPIKMKIGKPVDLTQYQAEDPSDNRAVVAVRRQAMEDIRQMVIEGIDSKL